MGAPARDELPIPDYDHLPVTGLGHRIRSLSSDDVERLLAYERAHGDRLPVVNVLEQRLRALDQGATPSSGDAAGLAPDQPSRPGGPDGPGGVSPATEGPPRNPPAHGDPTNPSQPRSTG